MLRHLKIDSIWGLRYAGLKNYKGGYLDREEELVRKYLRKPSDILVIGSGNGREARPICSDKQRIICLDKTFFYLETGKKLFAKEGKHNILFVAADMFNLPFKHRSFDFIFFSLYSFCGKDRLEVLRFLRCIMRPNGLMLMTVGTSKYLEVFKDFKEVITPWFRTDDPEEIRNEANSCGFDLIEIKVEKARPEYMLAMLRAV